MEGAGAAAHGAERRRAPLTRAGFHAGTVQEGVFEGACEYGQLGNGTFRGEKQSS